MPASNATVKTPAKKAPVRRKRAAATKSRKAAPPPVQPIKTETPKVEELKKQELKAWKDLLSLRGIEIVVLPLIFLEAWTIQILNNAGFEVSV